MPDILIEVDDKTYSDIETLETRFFAWKRAKTQEEKEAIVKSNQPLVRENPQALIVHSMRPPRLFREEATT